MLFYHACQIHASRWYHAIWRVRLEDFQINAHKCNSRIHIIFSAQQWRQFAKLQSLRYNVGYFNFVGYHYNRWASSYTVASVCTRIRIKIYREKCSFSSMFCSLPLMLVARFVVFFNIETFTSIQLSQRDKCSIPQEQKSGWLHWFYDVKCHGRSRVSFPKMTYLAKQLPKSDIHTKWMSICLRSPRTPLSNHQVMYRTHP